LSDSIGAAHERSWHGTGNRNRRNGAET
jgi:hypothetical protein